MCDGMGPRIFSIITKCSRFSWVCGRVRDTASGNHDSLCPHKVPRRIRDKMVKVSPGPRRRKPTNGTAAPAFLTWWQPGTRGEASLFPQGETSRPVQCTAWWHSSFWLVLLSPHKVPCPSPSPCPHSHCAPWLEHSSHPSPPSLWPTARAPKCPSYPDRPLPSQAPTTLSLVSQHAGERVGALPH